MAQARRAPVQRSGLWYAPLAKGCREGALIAAFAVAAYLLLALISYREADPGWSRSGPAQDIGNSGGLVGAWLADVFLHLFGYFAYLFPIIVAYAGWRAFKAIRNGLPPFDPFSVTVRACGFMATLGAGAAISSLHFKNGGLPVDAGGMLGSLIGAKLSNVFSPLGGTLLLVAVFLTGVTLLTGLSWVNIMDATGRRTLRFIAWLGMLLGTLRDRYHGRLARKSRETKLKVEKKRTRERSAPVITPVAPKLVPSVREERERQVPLFETNGDGTLPSLGLLDMPKLTRKTVSASTLEAMSRQVELKLADFGIEADVVAVHPGPVVTRFELEPAPGLKASRVSNIARDLARSLSTISVRVVEVIPGKTTIGLELPNEHRELVTLGEILKSEAYDSEPSLVCLALGKDIAGEPTVVDLSRMPHLLVAGTTGSGKSVAINAMILSMLYKAKPEDVRMIMIDPKMLELSVYEGIPHLLAPVVTDMQQASNALRWCVAEMERRYRLMSALGVRNVAGYNKKLRTARESGKPLLDPLFKPTLEGEQAPELEHLPFIVVVVDELADLMMVTKKKVEELIARLAQKARASGIHLILATQRPSVDVITGLIKANVPSRIAFQVSSRVDSRTILDGMGAEQLLGHGDMLYVGPGMNSPTRVHGAFVDDHEVHKVVASLVDKAPEPNYLDGILDGSALIEEQAMGAGGIDGSGGADAESDPLYDQAVKVVTESRRASISGVQRRLKIGYNRAARMMEQMEESGVVGPLQSNGAREVIAPPPV